MALLRGAGLGVDLPRGWEGRIYLRRPDPAVLEAQAAGRAIASDEGAVLHAANFALPQGMGDFGSGAVERMRSADLLVCLFEYQGSADQPLFGARGVPRRLRPQDFAEQTLRTPLPGMSAAQLFFNESGRAFCCYVVLGSHLRRFRTLPLLNQVLSTVRIT
jgi:hypothetical protein